MTLGVARQTVPVLHVLPGEPLQYSAFLHAFLAPKELAAVDALGGPGTPAVPLGAQWVAGQALAHALILWPVGAVEQSLVGVLEELVPGHRVYEAEAGVAVNEGQPAAQFPQRAQPQPADAQPLQGQRVGTIMQNSSPDYSQVLEDAEVRQAVWPR